MSRDDARAATLYTKACDTRSYEKCDRLGIFFEKGRGVAKE